MFGTKGFDLLSVLNSVYTGLTTKGIGVRGRTDNGVSERLATESTSSSSNTILSDILSALTTIAKSFLDNIWVRSSKADIGILALGTGYDESNTIRAAIKNQTQNIDLITLTNGSGQGKIDLTSDPNRFPYAEINQISIAGFNFSEDTTLTIRYFAYSLTSGKYYQIWSNAIEYGCIGGSSFQDQKKFMPNIFCDYDNGEGIYGYIETTLGGPQVTTVNYTFEIEVTLTPLAEPS